jgi:hypothetical protein
MFGTEISLASVVCMKQCGSSYIGVLCVTTRGQSVVNALYLCSFRPILALRVQYLYDLHLKMPV